MIENQRLSDIPTQWTVIHTAHQAGTDSADPEIQKAMSDLIGRYHDAVGRYLKLKIRDENLSDEVGQEFWKKLLQGKLAGADPSKGRFRDYLRTVLHRLIIDHFRGKKAQPLPPGDILDPSSEDEEFDHVWRESVINRVLLRLQTFEATTPNNRYATVLQLRREHPDDPIEALTERLAAQRKEKISPESFRKTLQRARIKFLNLLVQELRETIHPASKDDIEAEIYDLGLGPLYKRYSDEGAL